MLRRLDSDLHLTMDTTWTSKVRATGMSHDAMAAPWTLKVSSHTLEDKPDAVCARRTCRCSC